MPATTIRGDLVAEVMYLPAAQWAVMKEMAGLLASTKMFRGFDTPAKVMTAWAVADSIGISRSASLRILYPMDIQGQGLTLTMSADGQWGLWVRAGWRFQWLEQSVKRAAVKVRHDRLCPDWQEFEYTAEDAKVAGLAGKSTWQKYGGDMLVARLKTRVVRRTDSSIAFLSTEEARDMEGNQSLAEPIPSLKEVRAEIVDEKLAEIPFVQAEPPQPPIETAQPTQSTQPTDAAAEALRSTKASKQAKGKARKGKPEVEPEKQPESKPEPTAAGRLAFGD